MHRAGAEVRCPCGGKHKTALGSIPGAVSFNRVEPFLCAAETEGGRTGAYASGGVAVRAQLLPLHALDRVDQEGRYRNGDQREHDARDGDITQGQAQYRQVREQVGRGQPAVAHMGDHQRQRVVATAGTALPDDQPDAHAHEHAARQRRHQRLVRKVRQHRRELLPYFVEQGNAQGGKQRDLNEPRPQVLERQQVAGRVQYHRKAGRRDMQPVLDQKHQPDDAAFRDAGPLVDIMDAEGADRRTQQNEKDAFAGKPLHELAPYCRKL